MFVKLLKFELTYHFSQLTFKASAFVFFALGLLALKGGYGGEEIHKNGPYVISVIIGLLSLSTIFVSTLFAANVVIRDTTYKMESILFTTSITRFQYFSVRISGLFLAVLSILFLAEIGMLMGSFMLNSSERGPFRLNFYLQPFFILGVPNVVFSSSIIFGTALITRNTRAVYTAGVLLYILYLTASILGNSPLFASSALKLTKPDDFALLMDPFGLSALFSETRSWTDFQKNSLVFPLKNNFLLNRLLWSSLAVLLLAASFRFFNFKVQLRPNKKENENRKVTEKTIYKSFKVSVNGGAYLTSSFISQLKLEVIFLLRHVPFMVILLLWIFVFGVELKDALFSGPYGIHAYPTTSVIMQEFLTMRTAMLLIIFYTAELMGRETAENMAEIVYCSPVRNIVMWGSKCLTIFGLIIILISANIGIGVAIQISQGYYNLEIGRYLSLFYYSGMPLFLIAILAIFIQTLTSNKYLGMLFSLVAVFVIVFGRQVGIEHNLFAFGNPPQLQYSDMNGFSINADSFHWLTVYQASIAIMLSVFSITFWQRSSLIKRKISFKFFLNANGATTLLMAASVLWICSGSFIYYRTNVIEKYKNKQGKRRWQIEYEKKYKLFSSLQQPVIQSLKTTVHLFPKKHRYTVEGIYTLKNQSESPITKILAGTDPEVNFAKMTLDRQARQTPDPEFGQSWFFLAKPLLPNETVNLRFELEIDRSGFLPFNSENSITENGTYIELEKYIPFLGYHSDFETQEFSVRKTAGLSARIPTFSADRKYHLINFETTISTEPDQTVVTVGALQKSWMHADRKYFNFKTTAPINFMFALSSARYVIKEEKYKGLNLKICYQPGQSNNVPTMMQAMKDGIDYCSENFAPYPFKTFTLAEIPHYKGAATAYPGLMFSAENFSFLSDFRDPERINHAYAITVHEVSHQWWANILAPANQPGKSLLTESLAKYTELMVMEKKYGKFYLRKYLQADNQLYFALRNGDGKELPLTETIDDPHVYYQKGGLAMYAIKESLGEESVNSALRKLIGQHSFPGNRAIATDLTDQLQKYTKPGQSKLIDIFFKKVIFHDLKIEVLSCKPVTDGRFQLNLRIEIKKTDERSSGKILPDSDFDVAVFDKPASKWNNVTRPVYIQKRHFMANKTLLTLILDKKPKAVAIDPFCYILDENQANNIQDVK